MRRWNKIWDEIGRIRRWSIVGDGGRVCKWDRVGEEQVCDGGNKMEIRSELVGVSESILEKFEKMLRRWARRFGGGGD